MQGQMVGHEFPPLIGSDGVRCTVEISQDSQAAIEGITAIAIPPAPKGFKQLNKINFLGKAITLGVLQNPPDCSDGFLYVLSMQILQARSNHAIHRLVIIDLPGKMIRPDTKLQQ